MIKNKNYNIYEEKRGKGETRVQAKGEGRTEYSRQFWLSRGWNFARLEGHLGLEEVGASAESVILSKTSGLVKWRA